MSVFIKDMTKPKSCDECPIALWSLPKDCNLVVGMCPIVEIKAPHGRLIDEDTIPDRTLRVLLETAKAPTVIEAEVG